MLLSHTVRLTAVAVLFLGTTAAVGAATNIDDFVPRDLPGTLPGVYLAGRGADAERDFAGAIPYYAKAFAEDPANATIGERLVTLMLADGQIGDAFGHARTLIAIDTSNPIALIALAAQAIEEGEFAGVERIVAPVTTTALGKLTGGLLSAWASFGLGQVDKAVQIVDALTGPSWYGVFKDYNRAIILDAAGRTSEAATSIARAYQTDASAMKVVLAYARIYARNGDRDRAVRALNDYLAKAPVQPPVRALLQSVQLGQRPAATVTTARQGASEVLYGLGVAIGTDQGPELPAVYLRLAAHLDPADDLTILSLADVFQATGGCEVAVRVYDGIATTSPVRRNADLQTSNCLISLDRPQDAIAYARRVSEANPKDVEAFVQLGNVYRADDKYAEAADAYTRGIEANPAAVDWRILYYRGVAHTMADQWPQAEADFKRALTLNPGQPQVLNYLGYSWVDKGLYLEEALGMIKTAADQRPNDGYIIDSLGWAYYRLGRYPEAVTALERAVKLAPQESTLNDHLGDAYWMIGRKREATFQWAHARDFDPEPEELPKILAKLEKGLGAVPPPPLPQGAGSLATASPATVTVQPGETLSSISQRVYGDPGQGQRILDANRSVIADPNALTPGTILVIPR
jgi:tetratricopeptide (TPR) repeat protein